MSNEEAIANLAGLMASFHIEIKGLPDKLKCAKCKFVLKNACQVPCGCRFCRACIDEVISSGHQFCPGGLQECGGTRLSSVQRDFRANKSILKLTAKCPNAGCSHECQLADMESHMHACLSKNINCPFRELGCAQGALPDKEMSCHLLQESRSHSEILIETVANIGKNMEILKRELLQKDEQGRHVENEMKLIREENKSIKDENKSIKDEIKSIRIENESLKNENKSIKDENKSIKDENKAINNVNKSIKIDIKAVKDEVESMKIENESIKRKKEVLCDRVQQLSEKLEQEIDERHQSDERNIAMVTAVTAAVALNRDEMEPVKDDIRSIRDQFDCANSRMKPIQVGHGCVSLHVEVRHHKRRCKACIRRKQQC